MDAVSEEGDPLRHQLRCPDCDFTCSGPSPLASHLADIHDAEPAAIADILRSGTAGGSYRKCGPNCTHGANVGEQWRGARFDGAVSQHETCPSTQPFAGRIARTNSVVATLGTAAAAVRTRNPKPPSPSSLVGSLKGMLLSFADAATKVPFDPRRACRVLLAYLVPLYERSADRPCPPVPTTAPSAAEHANQCVERAGRELNAGHIGRANRQLLANPRFIPTESNEAMVRSLFPAGEDPTPSADDGTALGPLLSVADVVQRIRSRSVRTAPGPAGINVRTLKELVSGGDDGWPELLTAFLQAYADGWFHACPQLLELISTTDLTLIQKEATPTPNAKPRPIGVGDVLFNIPRAIIASHGLRALASDSSPDFGFAPSDGPGRLAACVMRSLSEGRAIILVDCANAFNSIYRNAVAAGVRRHYPPALRAFCAKYGRPSTVRYMVAGVGMQTLRSTRGVHQGDPLSPLFFQLGLKDALTATREAHPQVEVLSYLDDLTVSGDAADTLAALDTLKAELANIGLTINLTKTKLFSPTGLSEAVSAAADNLEITVVPPSSGFTLMGIPMGSPEFVATALLSRTETLAQRTNALIASARASPTLAQNHYRLLRFCIASANTYLLRAVKPSLTEDFADNVDALVTGTALELMELPRTATSPDEVRAVHRLQLPASLGGAGLGSHARTRVAAYIAGCVSVAPAIEPDYPSLDAEHKLAFLTNTFPEFGDSVDAVVADAKLLYPTQTPEATKAEIISLITNPGGPPPSENPHDAERPRRHASSLQHDLSKVTWELVARKLLDTEPDSHMRALQLSFAADPSSTLHLALVEHGGHRARLSRKAFITALRLQCGYPCFPRDAEGCCFICHHKCGPSLVHATMCQCPAGNSGRNTRHSHVQHTAVLAIRKAVPACNIAPGNPSYDTYFERRDTSSAAGPIQKADFLLSLVDKDYLVDINISGSAANVVEVAAKTAGAISRAGENRKLKEVTDRYHVAAGQYDMLKPFVLEYSGAFGSIANKFINSLVATVPIPPHVAALSLHAAKDFHLSRVWRIKALVAAAVHRSNHALVDAIATQAKSFAALSGPVQGEEDEDMA